MASDLAEIGEAFPRLKTDAAPPPQAKLTEALKRPDTNAAPPQSTHLQQASRISTTNGGPPAAPTLQQATQEPNTDAAMPAASPLPEAEENPSPSPDAPRASELTEAMMPLSTIVLEPPLTPLPEAKRGSKTLMRSPRASTKRVRPQPQATSRPKPSESTPAAQIPEAVVVAATISVAPPEPHSGGPIVGANQVHAAARNPTELAGRVEPGIRNIVASQYHPPTAELAGQQLVAARTRSASQYPSATGGTDEGHARNETQGPCALVSETELAGPSGCDTQTGGASQYPSTELAGQVLVETQTQSASQPQPGDGQVVGVNQVRGAIVGNLAMNTRRYEDLRRAHQRLLLQAKAACRYACDGDKKAGEELYAKALKGGAMLPWLLPYLQAMEPLETAIAEQAKVIAKLARQLPVWEWAKGIAGLSDRFLGIIVGECSTGPGEYKSVSALWKRMGLAVIDGERQRRVVGDAAIMHGYVARRRAIMWNIGESIIKQQVRKDPDDETARIAIGELGQVYLERKAYEATRTDKPIIAHARAKRYMEKRLLRELWKAWRKA